MAQRWTVWICGTVLQAGMGIPSYRPTNNVKARKKAISGVNVCYFLFLAHLHHQFSTVFVGLQRHLTKNKMSHVMCFKRKLKVFATSVLRKTVRLNGRHKEVIVFYSHLPRLHEVSAFLQWNVPVQRQRVMRCVENADGTINGRVFVQEIHVVDCTGERTQHILFLRSVLFAFQIQITCRFPKHVCFVMWEL